MPKIVRISDMKPIFISSLVVTFVTITCAAPAAWIYGIHEKDVIPQATKAIYQKCTPTCEVDTCRCCTEMQKTKVCMTVKYISPNVRFTLNWIARAITVAAKAAKDLPAPKPMCFPSNENPFVKICIKISKISVEKDHAGGCFSVSFSDSPESIALGCLFVGGGGLGNEPLFDQELLVPAVIDAILSEPVIPLLPFLQEDPQSAVEPIQAVPLMPSIQEDPKDSVNIVPASAPLLVPPQPGPKPFMEAARLASDQQLVPFRQEALMQFLKDGKTSHYSYEEDLMINDATDVMIFNENNCNCSKSPPSCDCCVRVKGPFSPIKACIHADIDESFLGFNLSLTINDWKLFEMHITGKKEFTKCEVLNILGTDMKVCIKLTDLSLRPGHIGGCVAITIPEMQLEERLGCFFMNRRGIRK